MKVYGDTSSGNCLKVKWVCDHLALPYTWIAVDALKGETRTTEFLKLNGAGQYRVTYHLDPPAKNGFARHTDAATGVASWWEPFEVSWTFTYPSTPKEPGAS